MSTDFQPTQFLHMKQGLGKSDKALFCRMHMSGYSRHPTAGLDKEGLRHLVSDVLEDNTLNLKQHTALHTPSSQGLPGHLQHSLSWSCSRSAVLGTASPCTRQVGEHQLGSSKDSNHPVGTPRQAESSFPWATVLRALVKLPAGQIPPGTPSAEGIEIQPVPSHVVWEALPQWTGCFVVVEGWVQSHR